MHANTEPDLGLRSQTKPKLGLCSQK